MQSWGTVKIYCGEADKDATIAKLKALRYCWECNKETNPLGTSTRLVFTVFIIANLNKGTVTPA